MVPFDCPEPLLYATPNTRYQMSHSQYFPIDVHGWVHNNPTDPALKTFYTDLLDHLLRRLWPHELDPSFTKEDYQNVSVVNYCIYKHKTIRFNCTTYNKQQEHNSVNHWTEHCNVMTLANDNDDTTPHPYWYTCVLGIFHASVLHRKSKDEPWEEPGGDLQQVGFILPNAGSPAFGFLKPTNVIRAVHLIPAFKYGQTDIYLKSSPLILLFLLALLTGTCSSNLQMEALDMESRCLTT
ncbi:hypothetical protein FA15DRAFT_659827 [Coprinopsis marcescibilis]|uniref:Uncharacterized protein n=1 Tax=Coprinopsis marcescibilis TaxID=230819 RepID=A0A5C3KHA5_COPMA|nr:hypothetical protein FA15DRAFT_659827 [Coprinopsis marcescibilis]